MILILRLTGAKRYYILDLHGYCMGSFVLCMMNEKRKLQQTSSPKGNDAHLRTSTLNSSQVSKRFFFSIGQGQLTPQSMAGPNSDVNQGS